MHSESKFDAILKRIEDFRGRLIAVVVHVNDTYLLDERKGQGFPGFPRVIATVKKLREHTKKIMGRDDRILVVHSGDFLGPSRTGTTKEGRQAMIKLLNNLGVNYCVLGNHEFDYGPDKLADHLKKAKFKVLLSNVDLSSLPKKIKLQKLAIWPSTTDPLVALTGVVSRSVFEGFKVKSQFTEPKAELSDFVSRTKDKAPFHIVLTHADRSDDRELREVLSDSPRTYVLGGHDHDIHWCENDTYPVLMKNMANLQTVRVGLLLAGGDRALNELGQNYRNFKRTHEHEPSYPSDVEAVLKGLHECDKVIFRAWLTSDDPLYKVRQYKNSEYTSPTLNYSYFSDEDDLPKDALAYKLHGIPFTSDALFWVLRIDDHQPAAVKDIKIVQKAVASVQLGLKDKSEEQEICDLSGKAEYELEGREEYLRSMPTDFGVFVAECVKLEGAADVAIVHSGIFRCDWQLPKKLCLRDIRDTFLYPIYDNEAAITVLTMNVDLVNALLQHGIERAGSGAFPQIARTEILSSGNARVAITSHLLTSKQDGYSRIISSYLGEEVETWIEKQRIKQFSIIHAIIENGNKVDYKAFPHMPSPSDSATKFIILIKELMKLYEEEFPYRVEKHNEWNQSLKKFLSTDADSIDDKLQCVRNEIRTFLRSLPKVKAYDSLVQSTHENTEIESEVRSHAMKELQLLRSQVAQHRMRFADGLDYHKHFDWAANGIAGWLD
ncbi:Calcineurin-like phosphoesterase [Nitrosospira briensis]|uniref:Calcineurin-like phosphoesterase n=1 Tax=Nitrosospira briensis TaxID=35799 RepID=A0A1I4XHD1_9PROT|nr:metallophosphoesterase [Nitrosospira briensis]SFN24709.1 Calcineurin-like phosphoesterase [Nitrosospira briensis]